MSLMERSPIVLICLIYFQTRNVLHIFSCFAIDREREEGEERWAEKRKNYTKQIIKFTRKARKCVSVNVRDVCVFTIITTVNATSHLKISSVNALDRNTRSEM